MALANVALTDTFDTWRTRTNQLVVIDNALLEGSHVTTGTITSTNTETALNVTAGSIRVKNNVFSSNAISFVSNSTTLTVSGTGRLGTTVYFDVGTLSTSVADQSTANIASANTVNLVNYLAVSKIGSVTSNGSGRLWANNVTDGNNNKLVFLDLATSGVTAGSYGGATQIPSLDIDAFGRVTSATTVTVQGMDYPYANSVGTGSNNFTKVAFNQANVAFNQANLAFNQANAAFNKANTSSIIISDVAPSGQTAGTLWWSNNYGRLFIYYNDGDSTQWVDAAPQNYTNAIYIQANTAYDQANIAYTQANTAFDKANNALANTTGTFAGSLKVSGVIQDSKGDVRDIPPNYQVTAYALTVGDTGKVVAANAGIFVPNAVFSAGQTVSIYNNTATSITITQNSSVTMFLSGTATTGNRTLAQRGFASIVCVLANTFIITGSGLT